MTEDSRPKRLQLRKEPLQDRSQAMVDDIVEAAARILVEQGYEQMTTNAVAERAGVSVGSLYQYFPHKDALIAELIDRRADAERSFMQAWIAEVAADDLESALEAIVRGALAFRATDPELHHALLVQMPHIGRFDRLREQVELAARGLVVLLERFRSRLPAGDVELARFVIVNAIHSLTHDGVLPPPAEVNDARLVAAIMRLVRGYLLPPAIP